jgi:hypothetical protein
MPHCEDQHSFTSVQFPCPSLRLETSESNHVNTMQGVSLPLLSTEFNSVSRLRLELLDKEKIHVPFFVLEFATWHPSQVCIRASCGVAE